MEISSQRIRDGLRAAARQRPAHGVPQDAFYNGKGGCQWVLERLDGVPRQACEQRLRPFPFEQSSSQELRWLQGSQAEARERQQVRRDRQRPQNCLLDFPPVIYQRLHEPGIRPRICAELFGGRRDRWLQRDCCAIVQRVTEGERRLDPLQPVICQGQGAQER